MPLLHTFELDGDQHLFGRHKEIKLLLEAYTRCKNNQGSGTPECVVITGSSGMGKTSLVQSVLRPKVAADNGIFLSGKFELPPNYQPYEVIISTFAQLADQLTAGDDRLYDVQLALADSLGDEIRILMDVIPGIEGVVGAQAQHSSNIARTESLSQFQFVFSEFCRAVSTVAPLVIFLDDMQWCDQASLELVQALLRPKLTSIESNTISSLLLVAASRDELEQVNQGGNNGETKLEGDVAPNVYLVDTFLNGANASRNVSRIHLSSLTEIETRDLILHNFGLTNAAAQTLASRAFTKCSGNILHTLQYVRSIQLEVRQPKNLDGTNVTLIVNREPHEQETVERLILQQVHKLPLSSQQLLQMAACMGNTVDEAALLTLTERPPSEISLSLEMAVKEELLELLPKRNQYRFIHDSVRQAVLSMVADSNEMSLWIGRTIWRQSPPSIKDSRLFKMINLLNNGITLIHDKEERYEVAELNLAAGRRAASKVSFRDASRYFAAGIKFLKPGDFWIERYDLTLQLCNAAATAELANRNFIRVNGLIEEIFHYGCRLPDKLDAYATQIMATGQQGKAVDATNIGLDVLRQLGEKVPTETDILVATRAEAIEAERALRGRSNADILSLPYMEDGEKLNTMRFLLMMIPYALEAGSPYANWIATRMVRMTLSHGLSKGCAHGFASYARFVCASNARLGYNYGQLAASIVEKYGAKNMMPRVYVSIYSMSSMWTRPLRESLNPLQTAFEVAVENGDVEYALIAAYFHSVFSLYVGMNLVQVEQLLKETRRKLDFYKQSLLTNLTNVTLQFVLNLIGKAPNTKILNGEVFRHDDRTCSSAVAYMFHGFSCKLAYLYEDFDLADQFARVLFEMSSKIPFTSYWFALHQCQMGLIAIAQVRRGIECGQNLERARLCINKMVGWARDCPHNFLNKKALLDAEMESLNSVSAVDPDVLSLYNQAIEGALEEGFLDEAAMACERAGDYMHRHNNDVEAERFWNHAQRIYRRWGATSKVEALKSRI